MTIFQDSIVVVIFILLFVVFLMVCALINCVYRVYQAKKHRRQHNIFEVGGKVVFLSNIAPEHDGIYTITEVFKNSCFVIEDGMDYSAFYDYIRHATDEEIKAGRRL